MPDKKMSLIKFLGRCQQAIFVAYCLIAIAAWLIGAPAGSGLMLLLCFLIPLFVIAGGVIFHLDEALQAHSERIRILEQRLAEHSASSPPA